MGKPMRLLGKAAPDRKDDQLPCQRIKQPGNRDDGQVEEVPAVAEEARAPRRQLEAEFECEDPQRDRVDGVQPRPDRGHYARRRLQAERDRIRKELEEEEKLAAELLTVSGFIFYVSAP